jgi:hypothetical protein
VFIIYATVLYITEQTIPPSAVTPSAVTPSAVTPSAVTPARADLAPHKNTTYILATSPNLRLFDINEYGTYTMVQPGERALNPDGIKISTKWKNPKYNNVGYVDFGSNINERLWLSFNVERTATYTIQIHYAYHWYSLNRPLRLYIDERWNYTTSTFYHSPSSIPPRGILDIDRPDSGFHTPFSPHDLETWNWYTYHWTTGWDYYLLAGTHNIVLETLMRGRHDQTGPFVDAIAII